MNQNFLQQTKKNFLKRIETINDKLSVYEELVCTRPLELPALKPPKQNEMTFAKVCNQHTKRQIYGK